jgi:enoyl-[acyl-carrier protein] reductase II
MLARSTMIQTRITRLLGIKHPVVLPGMSWISTPPLVAAVSNAGGLGILATGPLSGKHVICCPFKVDMTMLYNAWSLPAQETRESIRRIRELTDKPFGVGCTLMMVSDRRYCKERRR